jgi:hypothetical protein
MLLSGNRLEVDFLERYHFSHYSFKFFQVFRGEWNGTNIALKLLRDMESSAEWLKEVRTDIVPLSL